MSHSSFLNAAELPDNEPDQGVDEWVALFANRDEMAAEYAATVVAKGGDWPHWSELNAAILRRWSPAGLRYIKEKAWRQTV